MPKLQRVQCKREREREREREKRGWSREKEIMLDKRRNGTMNWELRIENWELRKGNRIFSKKKKKKNNNDAPHTFPQLSDVANRDWLSLLIPHGLAIFTPTKSVKKLW